MSEPLTPVPPPERDPWWDPAPARCSIPGCREILSDAHPASRHDSNWEGWCQFHGVVLARFPGTQSSEYPDQEETA